MDAAVIEGRHLYRTLLLTLGPIGLVSLSYWLTTPDSRAGSPVGLASSSERNRGHENRPLRAACEQRAVELRPRLGADCRIIVRPPYVLGGDLPESELDRIYRDVIAPTARALSITYFDHTPDEPITILIFASAESYQVHAERLDQRASAAYYGYYWRPERRVMLNLATGYGTLGHELTHALAHFDFPEMPEWFDEGLAALHEQSEFSADGLQLIGQPNWRSGFLKQAMQGGSLQPLSGLVQVDGIRPQYEAYDYALARYFCLYLQQRQLLGPFYRKFRHAAADDPSGAETLRKLFNVETLDELNRDFHRWADRITSSHRAAQSLSPRLTLTEDAGAIH